MLFRKRGCVKLSVLTLNLLTTTIVAPPSNTSKWQMGFNSAFKGLLKSFCTRKIKYKCDTDTWPPLDSWQRTEFSKEHMNHVQTSNQRNPNAQHTALYSHVTATAFILAVLLNKPYSVLNSYFNLVTVTSLHFYYVNISLLYYS